MKRAPKTKGEAMKQIVADAGRVAGVFIIVFCSMILARSADADPLDQNADLEWDATTYSGTGPVVYEVQRTVGDCALPDENPWNRLDFTQGINSTTYVDANLGEGMTFCYRVGAMANEQGDGFTDWSNRAEFTVPLVPRPAANGLGAN